MVLGQKFRVADVGARIGTEMTEKDVDVSQKGRAVGPCFEVSCA